jgi:integrase
MTSPSTSGQSRAGRGRHKRANGEGTIYQRKDGRWEGAAFVLTTVGTYRRVRTYAATREDARKKLTKLIEQSDLGIPVASSTWTVEEYLAYWLRIVVLQERRPKTYQGYESVVRLHLVPGLGRKRLAKLSAQDVRIFITRLRQECQCCKNGWDTQREEPRCCARTGGRCCESRLSPRMVQWVHAVLRNALECAVREEVIPRNVASLVKVTTLQYAVNRGLTAPQAQAVLRAARSQRLGALYVLALFLGLRRGELLGLRWEDVDLDGGKLEIVQTLQRVGGALQLVPPKTEGSRRTVPLPQACVEALREHKRRQFRERSEPGRTGKTTGSCSPPGRYSDGTRQPAPQLVGDPGCRGPVRGPVSRSPPHVRDAPARSRRASARGPGDRRSFGNRGDDDDLRARIAR